VDFKQHKSLFLIVTLILVLPVASVALQKILVYPQTEFFTNLWILGPKHTVENYPHNVTSGSDYNVFLGVANHLGVSANYQIEVKFLNLTRSAPDSFNNSFNNIEPIYSIDFIVPDEGIWETSLTFSFGYSFDRVARTIQRNMSVSLPDGNVTYQIVSENLILDRVNFDYIRLNDAEVSLRGVSSDFDLQTHEFFGNLVFELWILDDSSGRFVYHDRYVDLKFNMTG
jgi:hypothetical protein